MIQGEIKLHIHALRINKTIRAEKRDKLLNERRIGKAQVNK